MPNTDMTITPSVTNVLQQLGYNVADWDSSKTRLTDDVKQVLSTASKNRMVRLVILIEFIAIMKISY